MSITLVLGGTRSGKSSFAEKMAGQLAENIGYIATGQALDAEMEERIALHKSNRPINWETYEEPLDVANILEKNKNRHKVFLLDCLTLLISNILLKDQNIDEINSQVLNVKEKVIVEKIKKIISITKKENLNLIIVSNEVGLGLVPSSSLSRGYRDIVGRANQLLATEADQVILVWAGIPLQLKPELRRVIDE